MSLEIPSGEGRGGHSGEVSSNVVPRIQTESYYRFEFRL